jgi:hypothetical protein
MWSETVTDFSDCIEAHITGIAVIEESKTINISFRGRAKQRFMLVAEGVDRFVASEFREQNIADRVELRDSNSEPDEYQESLAALISGDDKYPVSATWQALVEKEIASIRRGEKVFVSIEAVYGASIALLAKRVTMSREIP